jgi:hypothetical protein
MTAPADTTLTLSPVTDLGAAVAEVPVEALRTPEVLQPMRQDGKDGFRMRPESDIQVARILQLATEAEQPLALCRADAGALEQPVWLDLTRINAVKRHRISDFTLTVEAGITLGDLDALLRPHGQQFPLQYPERTVLADVLAEDRPSLETGWMGYPRDYVLGLEVATPDGQITRCGGEVVKNVTGYDLNKLYVGSHHTLGVITTATLKLTALPEATRSWLFEFDNLNQAFQTLKRLLAKELPLTRCELYHSARLGSTDSAQSIAPWQLLLEVAGDLGLMKHITPMIRDLVVRPESESSLHPAREAKLFRVLSTWPTDALVVEAALPLGSLEDIYFRLSLAFPGEAMPTLQLRPGAGLMWCLWPEGAYPAPAALAQALDGLANRLKDTTGRPTGFFQLVQYPESFAPLAQRLNWPADPVVRTLMQRIKCAYDPNGVLTSKRLPWPRTASDLVAANQQASEKGRWLS